MPISPDVVIQAAQRPGSRPRTLPRFLIVGATGAMGNAVVRRLTGMLRACHTLVLARSPIRPGMRHVSAWVVPATPSGDDDFTTWPTPQADVAIVMFDPPRMYYGREKALWTPNPVQLGKLAPWIRDCGVHTLAVVLPHNQGSLPDALKQGLANLDEQSLANVGIDRLLIVRTAQKPVALAQPHILKKLAAWMLSVTNYMVPKSEQPVRVAKVAELVDLTLHLLPAGIHVIGPQTVWEAAQGDEAHMRRVLEARSPMARDSAGADTSAGTTASARTA
jgi:hypothetical protein